MFLRNAVKPNTAVSASPATSTATATIRFCRLEIISKPAALGSLRAGGTREPHVLLHALRSLRSGGAQADRARGAFERISSHSSVCASRIALDRKSVG